MSRLLHAAARGARIEPPNAYEYASVKTINGKVQSSKFWIARDTENGYIHPNDEHLQYGPISTALREMAKQPKVLVHKLVNLPHFGFTIFAESENELREVLQCDTLTHSLLFLILAEALADSGL